MAAKVPQARPVGAYLGTLDAFIGITVILLINFKSIGVFLNAMTILFSFGALMVAPHQGVFSISAVMSLGMAANVAVFLDFLPALLSLWGKR